MEKRLSLTIDPSKAKAGAKSLTTDMKELAKEAGKVTKALDSITAYKKLEERVKSLEASRRKATQTVDAFTAATKRAERAIEANYTQVKLLNTEVGEELRLSTQMVANKKLEVDASSQQAAAIRAVSIATKQEVKAKDDIVRAQERLTYVRSDEYKQLVKLQQKTKQYEQSVKNSVKPLQQAESAQKKYRNAVVKANKDMADSITANNARIQALSSNLGRNSARVKENLEMKERLIRTQAKLATVNSQEYKDLVKLERQLKAAEQAARGYGDQTNRAESSTRNFQRSMMGVGIAASMFSGTMIIQDLIRTADAFTELQNKLVVVTGSTMGLTEATDDLVQVAFDSRTSLKATVDLYSKLNRVNKQYGYSQKEVLTITETVSKAVAMSGATAAAAEGAVIQFSQALAGDFKTAGQELNSILEQTPGLSEALAQGLTAVGSMGEVTSSQLKKLASEGLISTAEVMEGLLIISDDISDKFALSLKTVSQSWQSLTDAFTVSLGKFDQVNGLTKSLTESIDEMTSSLLGSQQALGGLIGLISGGALLAIGGTVAALAALVGIPILLGSAAFLGLSAALGVLAGDSSDSEIQVNNLVESLQKLREEIDKPALEVSVFFRNELEQGIAKIDAELRRLEDNKGLLSVLNPFSTEQEDLERLLDEREALIARKRELDKELGDNTGALTKDQIRTELGLKIQEYSDVLDKKIELDSKLNSLRMNPFSDEDDASIIATKDAISKLIDSLNILDERKQELFDLLSNPDTPNNPTNSTAQSLEDLDMALLKITDPNKFSAIKKLKEQMAELNRLEKIAAEFGGLSEEQLDAARDKVYLDYLNALNNATEKSTKTVKDLNQATIDYLASLDRQLTLVGATELSQKKASAADKARKTIQKDWSDELAEGIITQEQYNEREREAIKLAEEKTEAIYRETKAHEIRKKSYNAKSYYDNTAFLDNLSGNTYQDIQKINKGIDDDTILMDDSPESRKVFKYLDTLNKKLKEAEDTVNRNWDVTGLEDLKKTLEEIDNTLDPNSEEAKKAKAIAYTAFYSGFRDGLQDAIASGDFSSLRESLAGSVGSAISQGLSQSITKGMTGLLGDSLGAGLFSGALGAIGGGVAGGLFQGLLSGSKTEITGEGYRIGIETGELFSAELSKSFKKSSVFGSKRWTEYTDVALAEFDSISNQINSTSRSVENSAKNLGFSIEDFTDTIENKDGDMSDAIEEYSNLYASSAFAAIEKYQSVGERFKETFDKLAEIATNITDAFEVVGAEADFKNTDVVKQYVRELTSQYESVIADSYADIAGRKEDYYSGFMNTNFGTGEDRNFASNYNLQYRAKYEEDLDNNIERLEGDIQEATERLADISDEAVQMYRDGILNAIIDFEGLSGEEALTDASSRFLELANTYAENFLTANERLQIVLDNANEDFNKLQGSLSGTGIQGKLLQGLSLDSTVEEFNKVKEALTDPEMIGKFYLLADAHTEYNASLEDQLDIYNTSILDQRNDLLDRLSELTASEIEGIEVHFKNLFESLTISMDETSEAVSDLEDVLSAIQKAIEDVSLQSTSLDIDRRSAALVQLSNVLTDARSGGSVDSDTITSIGSALSNPDMSIFTSYLDYAREQSKALNDLYELDNLTEDQLTIEEKTLRQLQESYDMQENLMESQIKTLEDQLEEAQKQSELLSGVDSSIADGFTNIADVLQALQTNFNSMSEQTTPSVNTSDDSAGSSSQGSTVHSGLFGGAFKNKNKESSSNWSTITGSLSDAVSDWASSDSNVSFGSGALHVSDASWWDGSVSLGEYSNLREAIDALHQAYPQFVPAFREIDGSHANGADYIPHDNYVANLHQGEMVLTAPVANMVRGMSSGSSNSEVVSLLRELISIVKSDSYNTNKKLVALPEIIDRLNKWDNTGLPSDRGYV